MFGTSGDHAEEEGTDPLIDRPSSAARLKASRWTARLDAAAVEPVRIVPVEQARERWRQLAASHPGATLYHSAAWAEVLGRAYGFSILLAMVERGGKIAAGCLLSPSKIPFAGRFIGLPFSDSAAPLGADSGATRALLDGLAGAARTHANFEIRGIAAPAPWQTSDCFRQWSVDIARPFSAIERGADRNFRRQVRRAMAQAIGVESGDGEALLRRFYRLQLETRRRLGVPPQPFRFFEAVHQEFAPTGNCEIWFARHSGEDLAGLVLLRDGDELYYKWGARSDDGPPGANHLLTASLVEEFSLKAKSLDLGRCDSRNAGLVSFKGDLGGVSRPLTYAFYPSVPRTVSSEVLTGPAKLVSSVWKRLPLPVTRIAGEALYRFLG
jgi:hypothetical protein